MLEGKELDSQATEYLRDKMRSRDVAHEEHRSAAANDLQGGAEYCQLSEGLPRQRHRAPEADGSPPGGRGYRHARVHDFPSCEQQVHVYPSRAVPDEYFLPLGSRFSAGRKRLLVGGQGTHSKVVEAEDPERPLSDSKIMRMLQKEGNTAWPGEPLPSTARR